MTEQDVRDLGYSINITQDINQPGNIYVISGFGLLIYVCDDCLDDVADSLTQNKTDHEAQQ